MTRERGEVVKALTSVWPVLVQDVPSTNRESPIGSALYSLVQHVSFGSSTHSHLQQFRLQRADKQTES